jgi:hypothetical protein
VIDCVLIVNDAPVKAVAPRDGEQWLRRPALEFLLARARRTPLPDGGWRRWLLEQHGAQAAADASRGGLGGLAGVAAAGLGLPAGEYWLATPVHLVAGLDTVRLHPAGLLLLDVAHGQQLALDFARVFAGSGWQLHATGARDLLLSAPAALSAVSDDPADWLGEDPRAGLPRGADARPLRTLATELEMWLYAHAVNRERESARQLSVSGLWLWGGGRSAATRPSAAGRWFGDDLVAQALWPAAAARAGAPASGWSVVRDAAGTGTDASYGASTSAHDTWHMLTDFNALEDAWLAPLHEDWRRGRVGRIQLLAGRWRYELTPSARWRFWTRSTPWWQRLGT